MMEKENTVVLSLDDYNKLRDFEKKVLNGKVISLGYRGDYYFHEPDEFVEEMDDRIKQLEKRNEKLNDPEYQKEFINSKELRTWSVFKFLKFRKKSRNEFKQRLIKCAENASNN